MKIETNLPLTAYHIIEGPTVFNYAIDARTAVGMHPNEWSLTPWTAEEASSARARLQQQGVKLPPPVQPTPEEKAAIDEHAAAVAEANERLKAFREKREAERVEAEQIAADEALVASPPPQPDPTVRRPLSPAQLRKQSATLTPAEQAEIDRKNATSATAPQEFTSDAAAKAAADRKAYDEKMVRDKAEADRQAAATASQTMK